MLKLLFVLVLFYILITGHTFEWCWIPRAATGSTAGGMPQLPTLERVLIFNITFLNISPLEIMFYYICI